jgi:hypothetical protein
LTVPLAAELIARNLVLARRRSGERNRHTFAAPRNLDVNIQVAYLEPVHSIRRSNHEEHRLAGPYPNDGRLKGECLCDDLDDVNAIFITRD